MRLQRGRANVHDPGAPAAPFAGQRNRRRAGLGGELARRNGGDRDAGAAQRGVQLGVDRLVARLVREEEARARRPLRRRREHPAEHRDERRDLRGLVDQIRADHEVHTHRALVHRVAGPVERAHVEGARAQRGGRARALAASSVTTAGRSVSSTRVATSAAAERPPRPRCLALAPLLDDGTTAAQGRGGRGASRTASRARCRTPTAWVPGAVVALAARRSADGNGQLLARMASAFEHGHVPAQRVSATPFTSRRHLELPRTRAARAVEVVARWSRRSPSSRRAAARRIASTALGGFPSVRAARASVTRAVPTARIDGRTTPAERAAHLVRRRVRVAPPPRSCSCARCSRCEPVASSGDCGRPFSKCRRPRAVARLGGGVRSTARGPGSGRRCSSLRAVAADVCEIDLD